MATNCVAFLYNSPGRNDTPNNPERQLAIAGKIVDRAQAIRIPSHDIIIDCPAVTVGADTNAGLATIETIRRVKTEPGLSTGA